MGIRDRMYELTQVEELDEFLERFPTGVIFKAGSCHKTTQTFGYVEAALDPRSDIHMAFIRVIPSRPVSNAVAERTGITHQSPQFILFVDGKPVYDVDNWDITLDTLEAALKQHLGTAKQTKSVSTAARTSDVSAYVALLQEFVQDKIPPQDFEQRWLSTFQMDATPRSTHEFEVLNSLFGDVDAAVARHFVGQLGRSQDANALKQRATDLLQVLVNH